MRSGRIPEKEALAQQVVKLSKGVTTKRELQQVLQQNGIQTYERNGKLTGVWNQKGTRKYRLKKLGIDLLNLDRTIPQEKERRQRLKRNRNKGRER